MFIQQTVWDQRCVLKTGNYKGFESDSQLVKTWRLGVIGQVGQHPRRSVLYESEMRINLHRNKMFNMWKLTSQQALMVVFALLDICACAAACVPFVDCVIIVRWHKLSSKIQIPKTEATKRQTTNSRSPRTKVKQNTNQKQSTNPK